MFYWPSFSPLLASRGLQLDGEDGEDDDEENWTLSLWCQLLGGDCGSEGWNYVTLLRDFFCLFDLAGTHRRELFNALWSSTNLKGDRYIIIWGISMKAIWPADACGQCWCWCRSLYLGPLWLCLFPCFGLSTGCVWWHWHVHCPAVTSLFLMAVCMDLCLVSPLSSQELEVKSRSRRPATSASLVIRLATGWRCSRVPRELLVLGDALLPDLSRYLMAGTMYAVNLFLARVARIRVIAVSWRRSTLACPRHIDIKRDFFFHWLVFFRIGWGHRTSRRKVTTFPIKKPWHAMDFVHVDLESKKIP